ncbi:Maf-like protein [Noviherbaspirillum suwonense]|uniref:7-methyl-GTP pyrophosphatase n=1 Tax=Noviherbaspirillum suwonense TaxID=1224511 RepID=A0ABY1QFH0_9BURK|nr:Maf-like protein [Noviherbaspirillum suwonense]SMP69737.1 septum formation protein [Noviherbaspirillum suwonense]
MTDAASFPRIILGSSSSYRKELLARLRLPFDVIAPDIDETALPAESPEATAMRLAEQKALAISALAPNALVIGSDQVATLDGIQIGKPGNHANALAQLQLMRGREVIFHTALCLLDSRPGARYPLQMENVQTAVSFRDLPDAELDAYLKIEQPYDCAGSARNEGLGIALISAIRGTDPTALTGLPLIALTAMLRQTGIPFFQN